ncbi:EscV/YscV/HrcV family type III secretion system export apparatus protein, partial [Pseudomonas sp. IPO3779]|nr:EscV/YscV/HrcV family type III secretion system export apparatus protein [Pseudomonas sp. IPO3779]
RVSAPQSREAAAETLADSVAESELGMLDSVDDIATETVALMFLVPAQRLQALRTARLAERFRSQFFIDYGLKIPLPQLRGSETLPGHQVAVLINEVRADQFD